MDIDFLNALAKWRGRDLVQERLDELGFSVPRLFQERVAEFCNQDDRGLLGTYWNEYALELVRSGFKVRPDARKGFSDNYYRSNFLDELFKNRHYESEDFPNPPLIRGLFEYMKKRAEDKYFLNREKEAINIARRSEAVSFGIPISAHFEKKSDIAPYVDQILIDKGFRKKGREFIKRNKSGLVFSCQFDRGGNPMVVFQAPLILRIKYEENKNSMVEFGGLAGIFPGIQLYMIGDNPAEVVHGANALVSAFDVFSNSFE